MMPSLDLVDRLLFPMPSPTYGVNDFPDELIWVPRNLQPENADPEESVPCLLLSSPSARFFILYLHSNAEDLGRCYSFCSVLRYQFQVHVLAVEYPGYGICPGGQANEESVIQNAFLAFRFLRQVLRWPLDEILVFGRSIGCGPALAIAAQYQVYGLILVCPFLSVRELVREFLGGLADLISERFPNKDFMKLVTSPLLLVHGKEDGVVPCAHGRALYEACRTRKRLVTPEAMRHNTNLHADATFFVMPMLQFFGLPDYNFDDLKVPEWAFDKRLSHLWCPAAQDESPGVVVGGDCLRRAMPSLQREHRPVGAGLFHRALRAVPAEIAVFGPQPSSRPNWQAFGPVQPAEPASPHSPATGPLADQPPSERPATPRGAAEVPSALGRVCSSQATSAPLSMLRADSPPDWDSGGVAGFSSAASSATSAASPGRRDAARSWPATPSRQAGREPQAFVAGGGTPPARARSWSPRAGTGAISFLASPAVPGEKDEEVMARVADEAVERYLDHCAPPIRAATPGSRKSRLPAARGFGSGEDEPPTPPEDNGFLKVPRTRGGGPGGLHRREPGSPLTSPRGNGGDSGGWWLSPLRGAGQRPGSPRLSVI